MMQFIRADFPIHKNQRNVNTTTGRANFDPALFEQELESGSIPHIQKGSASMQDYEGSQQEENDIEISYSIHCKLFPDSGPNQGSIPNTYHYEHGNT